ncbi:podocalyxin [Siniperca chuatsi]|uniref:podocalyxin n=1 Tax=Siniperca chuatsi TaxID=119488 RepID=UPI001CE1A157|nr:podocalyxin [Siniperca chuatsi]
MGATLRITWLLLLLSFLCHSVCSDTTDQNTTSAPTNATSAMSASLVVPDGNISGSEPTTKSDSNPDAPDGGTTETPPTGNTSMKNEPTQAQTPAKLNDIVPTTAIIVTATSSPADKSASTQPQTTNVTDNPPAPPTVSSGGAIVVNNATPAAAAAAATTSPLKTTSTAPLADSSGSSVVSPSAATIQTPKVPVPSIFTGTEGLVTVQGDPGNVGTTEITKVPTHTPTPVQQSMTHTTIASKTSQENSKESTKENPVTVTSHKQTASWAPELVGNTGTTGTTSTPSSLTTAGSPVVETTASKAGTMSLQTTTTTTAAAQPKTFLYSLNNGDTKEEEKDLVEVCRRLIANLQDGNCSLTWRHNNGKIQFDYVEINGKVKTSLANQYYEEITKKPTDNKTLIAILASCGALLIMIVILAVCASHHRKPYNENQQHLTEELHTVENGYHDNPTLEVMEVQPEMQEKKMALNGEFNNDSWLVPIDNLLKEDIPDEEDTHL